MVEKYGWMRELDGLWKGVRQQTTTNRSENDMTRFTEMAGLCARKVEIMVQLLLQRVIR